MVSSCLKVFSEKLTAYFCLHKNSHTHIPFAVQKHDHVLQKLLFQLQRQLIVIMNHSNLKHTMKKAENSRFFLMWGTFHMWLMNWGFSQLVSKISWWRMYPFSKYGTLTLAHLEEFFLPALVGIDVFCNKQKLSNKTNNNWHFVDIL